MQHTADERPTTWHEDNCQGHWSSVTRIHEARAWPSTQLGQLKCTMNDWDDKERERERTKPCSQRCQKPLKQHAIKCNQFNNFATPINYSNQRTNSTRLNDSTTYSSAIQQLIPTNSAISKVASETLATTTLPKSEASASLRLSTRLHKSSCEILCVRKVLQMMRISSGINMY